MKKLEYIEEGRSGSIIYIDGDIKFKMWYEFGGGDVIAFISIPSEENWISATSIPLEERNDVLNFIGATVARDKTSSGRYRIKDEWIDIY